MYFKILRCPYCANEGHLQRRGEFWHCVYCGNSCTDDSAERIFNKLSQRLESSLASQMRNVVDEAFMKKREEEYYNLRSLLWEKAHQNNEDGSIVAICRDIKKLDPHDFLANFYETVSCRTSSDVSVFLNGIDVEENGIFADLVIECIISSLRSEYVIALGYLIERAYKGRDSKKFDKYTNMLASEAQKVEDGTYSTLISRDVFVAHSNADTEKTMALVAKLEENGISCFVSERNLQRGIDAYANRTDSLQQAIRNCKIILFVSSKNSRSLSCNALTQELVYVRDLELASAPPEYRNDYAKMPDKYKKMRVEYRLDNSPTLAADGFVKEFFANLDYCETAEKVVLRIADYKMNGRKNAEAKPEKTSDGASQTADIKTDKYCVQCGAKNAPASKFCAQCGGSKFEISSEKYCAACNAKNLLKYKFCLSCGGSSFVFTQAKSESMPTLQNRTGAPVRSMSATEISASDFEIVNGKLVRYKGNSRDVVIPNTVTAIGDGAFQNAKNLNSVTIGDSVVSIGVNAFRECTELKSVRIGKGVTVIGAYAFYGCAELSQIYLNAKQLRDLNGESNVFTYAGRNTSGISVTVGSGVLYVPSCLFYDNVKLSCVEFERGGACAKIGYAAFRSCDKTSKVIIPANLAAVHSFEFGKILSKPAFVYI